MSMTPVQLPQYAATSSPQSQSDVGHAPARNVHSLDHEDEFHRGHRSNLSRFDSLPAVLIHREVLGPATEWVSKAIRNYYTENNFGATPISDGQGAAASEARNVFRGNRPTFTECEDNPYTKPTEIDGRGDIWSIAFLGDGRHFVSGGEEGKIRRWRVEDGKEMGTPMDAGGAVGNVAVSRDGKWVVSGSIGGQVAVWDAERHSKVSEFEAHRSWVRVVDVSPDATRIATGSKDRTVCVWSLSTSQRLLGPWEHDSCVGAVKFSPDGRLLATATWWRDSVRIYDCRTSHLLIDVPIKVDSALNQSLAWINDSERLFALSCDGDVTCFDVSTGTVLSQWRIHSSKQARSMALASNGAFMAASAESTFSFWDTTTHKQLGPPIEHTPVVVTMAISPYNHIVTGGGRRISLQKIYDLVPLAYHNILPEQPKHGTAEHGENLERTVRDLRRELTVSQRSADEREASLHETINSLRGDLRALGENSDIRISRLEQTVQHLRDELSNSQCQTYSLEQIVRAHEQKHQCEVLYAEGRYIDATASLIEFTSAASEEVKATKLIMIWLTEFSEHCVSKLECIGDEALNAGRHDEALAAYSTALSVHHSATDTLLTKWAKTVSILGSIDSAFGAAAKFECSRFVVYRVVCDVLEGDGRTAEATMCFQRLQKELGVDEDVGSERRRWEADFRQRCTEKLEKLADAALGSGNHCEAVKHLSTMLLLDPADRMGILIKRSKAYASMSSWKDALNDADETIKLNSSSYLGYERRHAVLHGVKRYTEAAEAFHQMLSILEESPDDHVHGDSSPWYRFSISHSSSSTIEHRRLYVDATPTIRRVVQQTIRHMPRILIDVDTGNVCDKTRQAAAFEELQIYSELVSSMTMQLDHARIYREVKNFYRYVMLSHRWENNEPLFQQVQNISIYDLETSPANIKLQTFCSLVQSLGFRWAWSDSSCVDKLHNVILQESLAGMFIWYHGSSLTIVYLRGVSSESKLPGGLKRSIWNTRGWTFQEYVAAETVQFYTEDWKPYLGLTLSNHKQSSVVISEMQQATGVSAQQLAVLRPGLDRVREKLYLASMRQTTLVEDAAYSLFGIFNAAIPVIYGEGNRAVSRLLEFILTGSGDVTILAWVGSAGSYNSCLPTDLTVYNQLESPHIPAPIEAAEVHRMVASLRTSLPDLSLAVNLYNRLTELPSAALAASRLRLPGIVLILTELVCTSEPDPITSLCTYRATSPVLGEVEIETAEDLAGKADLRLIHPWIRPLLDQEFQAGAAVLDKTTQALRFVVRLGQPFGALLLEVVSRVEHRRVAADALIMVRIREWGLAELIEGVRTVEVQ